MPHDSGSDIPRLSPSHDGEEKDMELRTGDPNVDSDSDILEAMAALSSVNIEELERSQLSFSLQKKIAHAEKILRAGAAQCNTPGPIAMKPESLVTEVLWQYTGLENALKANDASGAKACDSFQGLATALRSVYDQHDIRAN